MRRFYLLLTLVPLVIWGCSVQLGDPAAGFSWSWSIVDEADGSTVISCEDAGAEHVRMTVLDADGVNHEFAWQCEAASGKTDGWDIATGAASYTAQMVTRDPVTRTDRVLASLEGEFTFETGSLSNDLGLLSFEVSSAWDPSRGGGSASIAWNFEIAGTPARFLTVDDCSALGIDYAQVRIYSMDEDTWWTHPVKVPCGPLNAEQLPPGAPADWTGFYAEDLLAPGSYKFEVGFYKMSSSGFGDVLVATDASGTGDEPTLIEVDADENIPEEYQLLQTTVFDVDTPPVTTSGFLVIELKWHDELGGIIGESGDFAEQDCEDVVAAMGYTLVRNDGWVASESLVSDGMMCQSELYFEGVPASDGQDDYTYDLYVDGDDYSLGLLWESVGCESLAPSEDDTTVHVCQVYHLAEL